MSVHREVLLSVDTTDGVIPNKVLTELEAAPGTKRNSRTGTGAPGRTG